jgi:hypothetical protein
MQVSNIHRGKNFVSTFSKGHNLVSSISTPVSSTPVWGKRWYVVADAISSIPAEAIYMVSAYKVITPKKKKLFGEEEGITTCI